MNAEKKLVDALRIIAAHEVAAPLTMNDDNVSLSDLPFYVAGKAHAELGILHNIARNALDAYEARPVATGDPRFFIDHGQIHDRVTGKHITTDEDTVFCDGINHCLALLNELAAYDARPVADEGEVERVAQAIHAERQAAGYSGQAAWGYEPHEIHMLYMRSARAAIAAMSPQEDGLAELRALSQKATPGPWKLNGDISEDGDEAGTQFIIGENLGGLVGGAMAWSTELDSGDFSRVIANALLITAAVNHVRAEIERTGGV